MSATDVIGTEGLEPLLRGEAPRTPDEARRHALLGELRGVTLNAPESLRARLAAPAPARRRVAAPRPSRRLALVVATAALALAVLAAVVHGVTGSGGGASRQGTVAFAGVSAPKATATVPSEQPLRVGTTHAGAGAITSGTPSVGGSGRLQHTDASIEIQVPDVDRPSQRLNARKGTVTAGTTASVSLVLATKKAIVPVAHPRGRLGRMVHSAVGFLALEATIALYALIVVGPLALLAAFAWGLARARRRREERRLLAA